jgi:hypothetical protein
VLEAETLDENALREVAKVLVERSATASPIAEAA